MNKKVALLLIAFTLALSMLACQLSGLVPTSAVAPTPTTSAALPPGQTSDLSGQQDKLVLLYQTVSPGVVTIQTSTGLGSGWVYSADGYIVTNAHVVGSETKVEVDFPNGTKVYGRRRRRPELGPGRDQGNRGGRPVTSALPGRLWTA